MESKNTPKTLPISESLMELVVATGYVLLEGKPAASILSLSRQIAATCFRSAWHAGHDTSGRPYSPMGRFLCSFRCWPCWHTAGSAAGGFKLASLKQFEAPISSLLTFAFCILQWSFCISLV